MPHRNAAVFALFCCFIIPLPIISRPAASPPAPAPHIPAIFAFGDSTVDPGNNNHIVTLIRADHLPYGRALPEHAASGRFSDGKLATDYLASALGINDLLPAYLDPTLSDGELLGGASFGSAGSGLDELTANFSNALDIWSQLDYFDEATARIRKVAGERKGGEIVKNGLFLISAGSNDLLYNIYLLPKRMLQFSVSQYLHFLLHNLESVVQVFVSQILKPLHIFGSFLGLNCIFNICKLFIPLTFLV